MSIMRLKTVSAALKAIVIAGVLSLASVASAGLPAPANTSAGGGGGSVIPSSGFSAGANPSTIVPSGKGQIWYVDNGSHCGTGATACSDSNSCLTPTAACLTIQGMLDKMTSGAGDTGVVFSSGTNYAESVTISKNNVALVSAGTADYSGPATIKAASGVGLTITGNDVYVKGILVANNFGAGAASTVISASSTFLEDCAFYGDFVSAPAVRVTSATNVAAGVRIFHAFFWGGGVEYVSSVAHGQTTANVIKNSYFADGWGADIYATDTGGGGTVVTDSVFRDNFHQDTNKATYIDLSAGTTDTNTIVTNSWFNKTATVLTTTNIKLPVGDSAQGNHPDGSIGTNAGVQPKTFTSSNITQTGVLGFTASGTLFCTDINLETNSTGLAAGTNFTVTSNSAFGPAVICSTAVSGLGANKAVKCSAGTVTPLVPFTLLDTNTLTLKCTAADCTGAGTIKITPNCMRLTNYAGAI